jgi:hypothetical protein
MKVSPTTIAGLASIICFSSATLGRLSYETWSGDSLLERFDEVILWGLYGLGTALGVAAAIGLPQ